MHPVLSGTGRGKPTVSGGERGHRTRDGAEPWFMHHPLLLAFVTVVYTFGLIYCVFNSPRQIKA